jgi:tRNA uridine 5-carboxymethylaminomethyl modification enzyme
LTGQKLNGESLEHRIVRGELDIREAAPDFPAFSGFPVEWLERTALDIRYEGYIEKENRAILKAKKMDFIKIPENLDYALIQGLSSESKEKLKAVRPLTIGQAARIPGVRQGDIALLLVLTRKN